MNFKVLSALLSLGLIACAQTPAKIDAENRVELSEPVEVSPSNLPKQELTAQMLFDFLLGETALQRGHPEIAIKKYLALAETTRDPRVAQRATEIALHNRHPFAATKAVSIWTELDPYSVDANQTAAAMLVNAGRLNEARPHLEKLLIAEKDDIGSAFIQLNKLLLRNANKLATLDLVQQLSEPYPDLPEAYFAISQAAWFANQYDVALNAMEQALTLRPDWEMAAIYQGQIRQRLHYTDNVDYYKNYLDKYPDANELRVALIRTLMAEENDAEAREQLQQLSTRNPTDTEVAVTVGLLSIDLGDFDVTEKNLKKALDLGFKDSSLVHFHLARVYEETKRVDKAMASYRQVVTGGRFIPSQVRYASLLAQKGDLNDARQYLQKLPVANDEQAVHLILAEAQLLRKYGTHQDVFDLLGDGLKKQPESPELLYDRALAADKIGKFEILEQDLRKLIQIRPDSAHAYNALGYSMAERGKRLPEALELIEKAIKLSPDDAYIMDSLGWVYYRMGNIQAGLNYLNLAFAANPDPEIAAHLGEVLWMQGAKEDAEKIWRSAIQDNPDNKVLLDTMQRFMH